MAIIQPELTDIYPIYAIDGAIINLSIEQIKNLVTANSGSFKFFYLSPRNANCYIVVTQNNSSAITDVDKAYFADNSYLNITGDYTDVLGISPNFRTNSGSTLIVWYYQHSGSQLWSNTSVYWPETRKEIDGINYYCSTNNTNSRPIVAYYWGSGEVYINGQLPITYNWQSVPSISGKNGILSLVTLDSESINDGEPVSGAAVSVFDQNPVSGNNVKDIVDGNTPLIPSAVDVTAAFIISNPPVGELASRILAAKKGSIPESIEDADKTVSIPANASNVTMPGLDENSQYYFAIFVADATGDTAVSDPGGPIRTGERPIVPSPEIIMIVEKALIDGYEEYISAELVQ